MKLYVIIGDLPYDGLHFEKCFSSIEKARSYFNVLKIEYKNVGTLRETNDLIVFNNNDVYKILEIECNEID